ncbi:MAG TPA: glycosyltransferase [Methylomirabilota bacterium]|nr:glycosyltransferase [Methylomirabilota bacterium]
MTAAPAAAGEPRRPLRIVLLGLSITSSWGNGHATTFRGLVRELHAGGDDVLFLERDQPWYAANRDLPRPPYGRVALYGSVVELRERFGEPVREADLVVVGSYVPDGIAVGDWVLRTAQGVTAFYDIDTPVTLARLEEGTLDYLSREQLPRYDLYLSFTGGPTLDRLERRYGARCARALYCSVDPALHFPESRPAAWDLGYLGTYSRDRQPRLERLLIRPAAARRTLAFVVAGPLYPREIRWPSNVERVQHVAPSRHRAFYSRQRFTLNVTRAEMARVGYSPSVRLFEAAACGTPIISDDWDGLDTLFEPGREILVARRPADVLAYLLEIPEPERQAIGLRARRRALGSHTATHRAAQVRTYVQALLDGGTVPPPVLDGAAARSVPT